MNYQEKKDKHYRQMQVFFSSLSEHVGDDVRIEGETSGYFMSEEAACEYFDRNIFRCKWVGGVEREVDGIYYREINGSRPRVRLDRLIKTRCGKYVGVEIKKSKVNIGKVLAQVIDYTHSKFYSEANKEWVFFPDMGWMSIFPMGGPVHGILESVLSQNRIGLFTTDFLLNSPLSGRDKMVAFYDDSELRQMPDQRKVGSR